MLDDPTPRALPERTGRHLCTRCLAVIAPEEFFRNDHICDACAQDDEYPLASTPEPKKKDEPAQPAAGEPRRAREAGG